MIPTELVPDLDPEDGNRFSEKIKAPSKMLGRLGGAKENS